MRKILLTLVAICCLFGLVSCDSKSQEFSKPIELTSKEIILIVEQEHHLIANVDDPSAKLMWESQDEKVVCIKDGLVKAVGGGKTEVSVRFKDEQAKCQVLVVDKIVSKAYDDKTVGFNTTCFNSVSNAAIDGGAIAVMSGDYPEWVNSKLPYKLIGKGEVKLMGATGVEVELENLTFVNNEPPKKGGSTVSATKKLNLNKCKLSASIIKKAEELEGGSGIYAGKDCQLFEVIDCQIANYNQGIVIEEFSGRVRLSVNGITNCGTGICVNIKGNADMVGDYDAKGEIKGNVFNNCFTSTEFLFSGSSYYGELEFKDFSKFNAKPQLNKQE